ncbi:MAG TPA: PP2C family serine/threonine-protein phosphatase [Polyangiaceae bacterium]|jgi:serine/threonine protein phosphatase PrpC|nr:PP2C family serine/threonine-protein phosphatase [Polyangiaceae bacterium]
MSDLTITFAAASDVGHTRSVNEDAFQLTDLSTAQTFDANPTEGKIDAGPGGALLALSDGMGGHAAGEVASALVLASVRKTLEANRSGAAEQRLEAAVRHANADVIAAAQTKGQHGMGATLTAVLIDGANAYVAEVGDSRAYLSRSGRLKQLTRDQSLVQMLVDAGVMSTDEAEDSPQKNILLQAMGTDHEVHAAIAQVSLRRGDKLLLCSDGVSNAVSADELLDILSTNGPTPACTRMIQLANDRGGLDNLTVVVAHFDGARLSVPAFSETVTATFAVIKDFGTPKTKS